MNRTQLDSCIRRLGEGDRDAFHALYADAKDSVFLFALSIVRDYPLAEDVLQDSMLHIAAHAHSYRPGSNPKAWILSIVRNLCLDALKKSSRSDLPLESIEGILPAADDLAGTAEAADAVMRTLNVLTDREREIVSLYVFAGLRQGEIAAALQLPYAKVRSHYKYALKKMRLYYTRNEENSS